MSAGILRIGVDVGGTNTDAVLMDEADRLIASVKVPTTPEPGDGIAQALGRVVPAAGDRERVRRVMVGTTHAVNAIVQRRDLRKVAVVRVGAPATTSVRPLFGWPGDLRAALSAGEQIVRGGVEIDGRDIVAFDAEHVRRFLGSVAGRAEAVAVTGVFSPIDARQERAVEAIAREELGDLPVSIGSEVGGLGLLERENTAVLNAALGGVAERFIEGLRTAIGQAGLDATTFVAQNDGTLMALERAGAFPVLTVGSGASNSLRGAAVLAGIADALVADVGGTTTDVGALTAGYPRTSAAGVTVGDVHTNFRMPDIVSVAVGGGTVIEPDGALGIHSVGAALISEGLVFGGSTPTFTDAAVASGRARIGDPALAGGAARFEEALAEAERRVAEALDRMRLSAAPTPVIVVGGGSVLFPDGLPGLEGRIHRPEHAEVANAIGAAIAHAGGEIDRVEIVPPEQRRQAIDRAVGDARDAAAAAGADPERVETLWIEDTPLAYLDVPAVRLRVKVAGPLRDG